MFAGWNQTVPFGGSEQKTVYSTNWAVAILAAIVGGLLGVVAVLPLYAGWWELGRDVSLNPLETALAFDAPLLAGVNSNANRDRVVRRVGHQCVQYGVAEEVSGAGSGLSGLAGNGGQGAASRCRLRLVATETPTEMVQKPRQGDTFS
jgi:hypothetical protein